jgi:hypothetical protein
MMVHTALSNPWAKSSAKSRVEMETHARLTAGKRKDLRRESLESSFKTQKL